MIVIEQNNKYVGIFIFKIDNYTIEFDSIIATWEFASVAEEFRNMGFGKKLYEAAIDACLKKGASIIDTDVADKNIISQKLHDKLGFQMSYSLYTFHKWF
jgi:ribosomal protein S18 acetylase RimI-like enzyme